MPGLAQLNASLDQLDTAKANVAANAAALIASGADPIPRSVIDRVNGDATAIQATADALAAATPPPAS